MLDQLRVAPLSSERGIGCEKVGSDVEAKSSPASVQLTDGKVICSPGEMGALLGEDGFEKKE